MRKRHSSRRLSGPAAVPDYTPSLAARSIDGHLLRTGCQVWAWYRLSPQRWSFRSDIQREDLINAIAGQYAELQGRWLHVRVTSRPFAIQDWAAAHVDDALDPLPDSDLPGAPSFDDYMAGEQRQLYDTSISEKEVYIGVEVQTRTVLDRAVDTVSPLLRRVFPDAVDAELVALDGEVEHLDQVLGSAGLDGRPVIAAEMQWLMYRSCTLGLPAPSALPPASGTWAASDLASFDQAAQMFADPYSPTVTVQGTTGAAAGHRRDVAILTAGQMLGLRIPEVDEPWSMLADRVPEVEQCARIYVQRPEEVTGKLRYQMNKVRSQERHYTDEHGLEPPTTLANQGARVLEIEHEMSEGLTALATRVRCWWRFAVSAVDPTAEAADHAAHQRATLKVAQQLLEMYKPKIAIEHPEAQHTLAREFIPGEPVSTPAAHERHLPVRMLAAAMPQATADVGDRQGILLGETCTATRRPVAWAPWMAQEIRDASGLTAMVGGLGAGKSFLGGGIVYKTLRSGARWTLLDPSGPLTELCKLPELRPYARPIHLLNAQPGILNPYRVVPEPRIEAFGDEPDPERAWHSERGLAAATRRQLILDVFTGVLPDAVATMPETRIVLLRAVRAVGGRPDTNPASVIEHLRRDDTEHHQQARMVADFLDEMRERMSLLIPEGDADPYSEDRDDRLTVLSMAGLTLPKDGTAREHWNDAEAIGVQLLNLAAWLTQRSIYERSKDERKGVWIDEAFFLSSVPSGRTLMNRFARDSRKWNVRVLLSSQIPNDFLRIDGFTSLVDSVFVGRLDDEQVQADALRLLGVQTGVGYERMLTAMGRKPAGQAHVRDRSPRQFLFADGADGVERIRADFSGDHLSGLRTALDTTPGARGGHETDPSRALAEAARDSRALRPITGEEGVA